MPTNDFLAFATAGGANVVSQATYAAAGYVGPGRSSGILPSNVYNKIARQGNFVAHCVAQFIVNQTGLDALDNGDDATFITNLTAAVAAASPAGATSGDAKITLKTAADSGWLMMDDGTIGDASSGATHIGATFQNLFTAVWNGVSNSYAVLYTSAGAPVARGVSAAADWAAHRRLGLTLQLGRALCIAGAGVGLTNRQLGQTLGEETHLLTVPEIPAHNHSAAVTDPGHVHGGGLGSSSLVISGGSVPFSAANTLSAVTGISVSIGNTGGGASHNNMQPSSFWNIMIKL